MTDTVRAGIGMALVGLALVVIGLAASTQLVWGLGAVVLAFGLIGTAMGVVRGEEKAD